MTINEIKEEVREDWRTNERKQYRANYDDQYVYIDSLIDRTALAVLDMVREELKQELSEVLPLPEDAKRFMGEWERGVVGGGYSVKERVLSRLQALRAEIEGCGCGEWTGKESYDCNKDGARTKPGTCSCPCHLEGRCDCAELTCKEGCPLKHTHKGFSCSRCHLEDRPKSV